MFRPHLLKPFTVIMSVLWIVSLLLTSVPMSQAQSTATTTPGVTSTPDNADDSDELPIYVNITGTVQEITATSLRISDQVILIPPGMVLPPGITKGKPVSLRGNLRNDDTIIIIVIVPGYRLPTATPTGTATVTPLPTLTLTPSLVPTATPNVTPQPTSTAISGCNKSGQRLALLISAAYGIPYAQVVTLHCRGYSFGVIARLYLVVFTGEADGKTISLDNILLLRERGTRWSVIIVLLDVQPDTTVIVFVINGGNVTFIINCNPHKNKKIKPCIQKGKGKGKGKGEDGDD